MTSTTELNWKYLGEVNVDIGVLLIADEQHFRDLHNKWDDAYDAALNDYDTVGYVPDTGGDGSWEIYGHGKDGVLENILIAYDETEHYFDNLIEFKQEKIQTIKVHTGKIAINDPSNWFPNEIMGYEMHGEELQNKNLNEIAVQNSFSCPLGNGDYDVYETKILYKPYSDSDELTERRFGVVINLNPKKQLESDHLLQRVVVGPIYKEENVELIDMRNLLYGRAEYFAGGQWTSELFHQCLLNGFNKSLSSIYNRSTHYLFMCKKGNADEIESALQKYSKDNLRQLDKEDTGNNFISFYLH